MFLHAKHLCSDIPWWAWGVQIQCRATGTSVNTALKTLMSFGICGKPQIFRLQQNICCLLPMAFLIWNQDQLYHILFPPLHRFLFFEFFGIKCTQVHIWTWMFASPTTPWKQTCWLFFHLLLFAGFSSMLMLMKQNNLVMSSLQLVMASFQLIQYFH